MGEPVGAQRDTAEQREGGSVEQTRCNTVAIRTSGTSHYYFSFFVLILRGLFLTRRRQLLFQGPNVEPDVNATAALSRKFSAEMRFPHRGLLRVDDLVSGL